MERLLGWLELAGRRGWQLGGLAVGFLVVWTVFQHLLLLIVTIFLALLLAVLLAPVARWLERTGLPSSAASLVSVVATSSVILGAATLIGVRIAGQMGELARQLEQARDQLTTWLHRGPLGLSEQQIQGFADRLTELVQGTASTMLHQAFTVISIVGALITAVVVAFFLIRDADQIERWITTRLVPDHEQALVAAVGRRAGDALQGYIRATVIIGALDAALIGTALVVLDVPLAFALAGLTFLGAFFPVVGATVAGLLATLVAVASQGLGTGLIVAAVVVVVQQVDGNVLQPLVMGRAVHLHPIVVLAALTAGGLLAGIVGAFMAVPVVAVLSAAGNEYRTRADEQAPMADRAESPTSP